MVSKRGGVVHVLDTTEVEWASGKTAKTVCGRKAAWYFTGLVLDGDRPCELCDKKVAVLPVFFKADQEMKSRINDVQGDHYSQWLDVGLAAGWISEPSCYIHGMPPLTDEEVDELDEMGETENCIFMVRLYHP